jgi:uncharacterized protein YacL
MLRLFIFILYTFVCSGAIATYVFPFPGSIHPDLVAEHPLITFVILLLGTQLVPFVDWLIPRKRIELISAVYMGLLVGVLLSYLLIQAMEPVLDGEYRSGVVMLTLLMLPYLCISLLLQTKDDFRFVIPYVEFSRELKASRPLVLDSSALIDGRIRDVVETHIFDAEMVVPQFILNEIQDIADSNEKIRRSRGRRGLEILNKLQNNPKVEVRIIDSKLNEFKGMSVDQALVELTKQLGGRVVTNDFNLNKVASVQGIPVINLNDVANSLKPRYLPGERLNILLLKEGETPGQGIGYLDDGTMVVCEQAGHLVGKEIDVVVTSVLQSSAGRMIFGRQVHSTDHA